MFSSCTIMKKLYRDLGNKFGSKKRLRLTFPDYYVHRIKRLLHFSEKYNVIQDGQKILELGTGWAHWEALSIRLFFEVEATLYDVWDNRQLEVLKKYCSEFDKIIDQEIEVNNQRKKMAHSLIKSI